jgi:hypothetical protein
MDEENLYEVSLLVRGHSSYEEVVEWNLGYSKIDRNGPKLSDVCDNVNSVCDGAFSVKAIIISFDNKSGKPTTYACNDFSNRTLYNLIYIEKYIDISIKRNNNSIHLKIDLLIERTSESFNNFILHPRNRSACKTVSTNRKKILLESCQEHFNTNTDNEPIYMKTYIDHLRLWHPNELPSKYISKKLIKNSDKYDLVVQKNINKIHQFDYILPIDKDLDGMDEILENSPLLKQYSWYLKL